MKIVDLHCDTISAIYEKGEALLENNGQYDIQRALQANVALQFFALFTMPSDCNTALRQILKLVDKFYEELSVNKEYLYHFKKYNDILLPGNENKIGCLLHMEGAEAIGTDMEILRLFYRLGVRSIGITWNNRNLLADGVAEEPGAGGLSCKGREVITEMDRLGMILDLAHISKKSFYESLEYYAKPVMVTHANARALCNHPRNLDDEQLQALAEHGGVIGISQVKGFVNEKDASLEDMLNHIVYVADLIGVDYVSLGADFDGADSMVIPDIKGYEILKDSLINKGFNNHEVEKILITNALSVIEKVL